MSYEVEVYSSFGNMPYELQVQIDPYEADARRLNPSGYHDERGYLVILHDDQVVGFRCDGMEPEDAYFFRDLGWVSYELERAYKLGLEDGKKAAT